MSVEDRLANLFERGGVTFSIETVVTKDGPKALVTITKSTGSTQDTVGGTYENVDEGINDCIDKLDEMARKRSGLKVIK